MLRGIAADDGIVFACALAQLHCRCMFLMRFMIRIFGRLTGQDIANKRGCRDSIRLVYGRLTVGYGNGSRRLGVGSMVGRLWLNPKYEYIHIGWSILVAKGIECRYWAK